MLLAIDAGNTNIVFAVFDGATLKARWRLNTDSERTADEYAVWLRQLLSLENMSFADIADAIICSVVPPALRNLRELCRHYLKCTPLIVEAGGADGGIPIRIDKPSSVGADRIANAVGAHARFGGPLIVIDFGTATTLDVIAADGGYEGGIIAPGVNLSVKALTMAAAKLPDIAIAPPPSVIGRTTEHAMQSGVFLGYVAMIEGLVGRIKDELGTPVTVIATGGLAPLFEARTEAIDHADDTVTIDGLRLIHARHRAG